MELNTIFEYEFELFIKNHCYYCYPFENNLKNS